MDHYKEPIWLEAGTGCLARGTECEHRCEVVDLRLQAMVAIQLLPAP